MVLGAHTDALSGHVMALEPECSRALAMAERYDRLAATTAEDYPSLEGPARELARLWRELGEALERLGQKTEREIAAGGTLADQAAAGEVVHINRSSLFPERPSPS